MAYNIDSGIDLEYEEDEGMNDTLIKQVVDEYVSAAQKVYGSLLYAVILFGSCARGDYEKDSDIDLMVLLNVAPEEIPEMRRLMRPIANQLDLKYDCVVSATFQSSTFFEAHKQASVFYQNVDREGLRVG